jgi:hypothetical protein
MLNTIKIQVLLIALVLLPIASNVWADQSGRDDGHSHHGHGYRSHANPDLTLVSGMDNIDSRVLVDPAPEPAPKVIYESVPEVAAPAPSQLINSDADGNFIVNVPNNVGGYTPIRIQKSGNGYVGPQGEMYYPFPQVTQLKAMYGL